MSTAIALEVAETVDYVNPIIRSNTIKAADLDRLRTIVPWARPVTPMTALTS